MVKLPPGNYKMTTRWCQNEPQIISKWPSRDPKLTPPPPPSTIRKWPHETKMILRTFENDSPSIRKWSADEPKTTPDDWKMTPNAIAYSAMWPLSEGRMTWEGRAWYGRFQLDPYSILHTTVVSFVLKCNACQILSIAEANRGHFFATPRAKKWAIFLVMAGHFW